MSNKVEEKEILFSVYNKELIENCLIESETPDFILTDPLNNEKVGVEITTLYCNQASGMSRNDKFLDSFVDDYLKLNPNKKKKKKKPPFLRQLNVAPVEGSKGYVHKEHVVWSIASLSELFSSFEKIVLSKSESYISKRDNLQFVNLIVSDKERFYKYDNKLKVGFLYQLIRQHSLYETLLKSSFQEIFYVTEFPTGTYSVPLKWLIFICEFEIFKDFWKSLNKNDKVTEQDFKLLLSNFIICMIHLGFTSLYLFQNELNRYIIFATHVWIINLKTHEIEDKPIIACRINQDQLAQRTLINYENYVFLFESFIAFRENKCPVIPEEYFPKIA